MSQEDLRERSGSVNIKSRLVSFLYDLMRDHLTAGQVEELVRDSLDIEVAYTNGHLAQYAWDLANRLQPTLIKPGGILKEVLRNRFQMVKEGYLTPLEAADKVYAAITEQDPLLSTGKSRRKNETVDPPRSNSLKAASKQSIIEAEDESVIAALKEASNTTYDEAPVETLKKPSGTIDLHTEYPLSSIKLPKDIADLNRQYPGAYLRIKEGGTLPAATFGIWADPVDHNDNPHWVRSTLLTYEAAIAEVDRLNHEVPTWHHTARPKKALQPSDEKPEIKPAPSGSYGVFCEPLGHMGDPKWSGKRVPMTYEEATKEADFMCRANNQWHYYAKPIR
jgi:hypothetical protein